MKRFYELDFLRGSAIILMIIVHILHILNLLGNNYNYPLGTGFWLYFSRSAASMFILLAGISLTLSTKISASPPLIKILKRGLKIFSWGLIITFITWFALKEGFVVFGILHFIGLSLIISYPFLSFSPALNLLLGIAIILLSLPISQLILQTPWLLWLGLRPAGFHSIDYFPLFPWFGIFLTGIALGNTYYPKSVRKYPIPDLSKIFPVKCLCFIGRNSLAIYLMHIPALIIALLLMGYIDITLLFN
ncbi:DUF1624 domain-containing protein [Candidatus Contubernalis alkalaceticus]|nr:DUF1624 domain-containing protein [Candidatus Contubernalis alkalaceticus]